MTSTSPTIPAGATRTNDLLNIVGNLSLAGTNTIAINPLNTNLAPGTYTLIRYSGSLTGGLANLIFTGIPGVPAALTNPARRHCPGRQKHAAAG